MSELWQRFTDDPEDVAPVERCAARDGDPVKHRSGICLRRKGHPSDWHEGRSRSGNLVSWTARSTEADGGER